MHEPLSTVQADLTVSQTSPCFYVSAVKVFWKLLWEKMKLIVRSNFSFSHSVFYLLGEFSLIFMNSKLSSANSVWMVGCWFDPRQRQTKFFKTGSSGFPLCVQDYRIALWLAHQWVSGYCIKPQTNLTLSQTSSGLCQSALQVFWKILWEKEKLLVTSNFSFSQSVFYLFREISVIFIKFKIFVCKLFQFGSV